MFKPGDVVRRKEAHLRDEYWFNTIRGQSKQLNKALSLNGTWVVESVSNLSRMMNLEGIERRAFGFRYFELAKLPSKNLEDYL